MGENKNELDLGQLYFIEPDGSASPAGDVTDVECTFEENDISAEFVRSLDIETAFDCFVKATKDTMLAITGMYAAVINCCPNRRVAHLALHGKTARIRKKNFNRAIKILEEIND